MKGIRSLKVETGDKGRLKAVKVVFGPHFYIEIAETKGKLTLNLGATHHGIKAVASEVGGELDRIITDMRAAHPANVDDNGMSL